MQRSDLEMALDERTFNPFVLTYAGGSLPVTDPRKALLGLSMVVVAGGDGRLYQIPFRAIERIG